MLLFGVVLMLPMAWLLSFPVLSYSLVMYVTWVWCRVNHRRDIFLYGFRVQAAYFPWVMLAIHFLMSDSGAMLMLYLDIVGAVAGHCYNYFAFVLPLTKKRVMFQPPYYFVRFVDWFVQ
eukprot:NODE_2016_length_519_cov_499.708511_g1644_i0.p1 GENE.NODE_2016_length_519_cov_499.708511_g1644_i0~~NODE_2016_length_519_cov_499.708511_g1644_i0.p1  ORF type:complete len:119 (+),score=8.93 NODE_2016_length_519_cov_499.708511_g1644_i0:58-414(+)